MSARVLSRRIIAAAGDAFELVLRQIELGMDLSATTDLQQLLGSRDQEGGLPAPDLSAPHPFRGSGPGLLFSHLMPTLSQCPAQR